MSTTYPHDDDAMFFDERKKRYILKKKYVFKELGENLDTCLETTGDANPATLPDRVLDRVSSILYRFIYRHNNKTILEMKLACEPKFRDVLREAMGEQLLYVLSNGFLGDYAGVNFETGNIMNADEIRGKRSISHVAYDILEESGILYTGRY